MNTKVVLCIFGVATGAFVAAASEDTIMEMLGYAPEQVVIVENDEEVDQEISKQSSVAAANTDESNTIIRDTETETVAVKKVDESDSHSHTGEPDSVADTFNGDSVVRPSPSGTAKTDVQNSTQKKVVVAKPPLREAASTVEKAQQKPAIAETKLAEEPRQKATVAKRSKPRSIDGRWSVVHATHAGKEIDSSNLKSMTLEIDGSQLQIRQSSKLEKGTLERRGEMEVGDRKVTQIEIGTVDGSGPVIKGFYFFDDETLTMVWGRPGAATPDSLDADKLATARILKLRPLQ